MNHQAQDIPLKDLHFDLQNPRYGRRAGDVKTEHDALDMIVSDFLVDDLLSSIAVNGFFEGEPLIAKARSEGGYLVLEGNRRLASLLILSGDPRASGQKKRSELYRAKMEQRGRTVPTHAPVIALDGKESFHSVLAYLGTKHIVGPSEWDSFAKAKWMAEMRDTTELSLSQIKEMIGDTSGLVDRMLEGYYIVEQAREDGVFDPSQSYLKGRGSNPEFPFSWIYTALNLTGVRRFLELGEKKEPAPSPLEKDSVQRAGDFFDMIFGNRHRERKPVIDESRDLPDLARALTDPIKSARLKEGTPLIVVEEESKPLTERLSILVTETLDRLQKANGIMSSGGISVQDARVLDDPSLRVVQAARSLREGIKKVRDAEEDGADD
jgi:hypothetical protein